MKVLFAVLFLSSASLFARLGETPDQCQMRYGSSNGQRGAYVLYYKDHFDIAVMFRDGKSTKEVFSPNTGATLSDEMIEELLRANSEGSAWTTVVSNSTYRAYRRNDDAAFATLEAGKLTIEDRARKTISSKPSTSGF